MTRAHLSSHVGPLASNYAAEEWLGAIFTFWHLVDGGLDGAVLDQRGGIVLVVHEEMQ